MDELKRVSTCADRLREAIHLRKIKQVDLSKTTGIDPSAISRYLSGRYEPKSKPVYELAKALDVSEPWLWGYDVPMDRPKSQKESDAISDITVKLTKDNEFLTLVTRIVHDPELYVLVKKVCNLDEEKRRSWSTLL